MLTRTRFYTNSLPLGVEGQKIVSKGSRNQLAYHECVSVCLLGFFHFFHASNFWSKLCKRSPIRSSGQTERKFNFCTFQWQFISLSWCSQNRGNLCANHKTVSAAMHQEPSMSFHKCCSGSSAKRTCIVWVTFHRQVQCIWKFRKKFYFSSLQHNVSLKGNNRFLAHGIGKRDREMKKWMSFSFFHWIQSGVWARFLDDESSICLKAFVMLGLDPTVKAILVEK